jgi:hypothetical protein
MPTSDLKALYDAACRRERGIASRLVENARGYFPEATEIRWRGAVRHRARIGSILIRRMRAERELADLMHWTRPL